MHSLIREFVPSADNADNEDIHGEEHSVIRRAKRDQSADSVLV